MKVRAQQGDTLDGLCWRHYGRTQGVVEQALETNPGLADGGAILTIGQWVELPDIEMKTDQNQVQLWD